MAVRKAAALAALVLVLLCVCGLVEANRRLLRLGDHKRLVIAVLSARHNKPVRDVVRRTWLGWINRHPEFSRTIMVRFVVGAHACPEGQRTQWDCNVDVQGRAHAHAAEEEHPGLPLAESQADFSEEQASNGWHYGYYATGTEVETFTEFAHFDAALSRWGPTDDAQHHDYITADAMHPAGSQSPGGDRVVVRRWVSPRAGPVVITGHVRTDGEVRVMLLVDGVELYAEDAPQLLRGGRDFDVHALLLEGSTVDLAVDGQGDEEGDRVAVALQVRDVSPAAVQQAHAALVGAPHREAEARSATDLTQLKEALSEEDRGLQQESEAHGDMFFADVIDVYRHLPAKLRLFYRHLARHVSYDFVLKVDDDTYVRPDRIMKALAAVPRVRTWWGHLRCNWGVPRGGKWAEPDYTSTRYPCFGGGGGNVLTSDLANWVGRNAPHLYDYQGEDVSMGIWLSALAPTLQAEDRFHSLKCRPEMFSHPELKPHAIQAYYNNWQKCGRDCGCA